MAPFRDIPILNLADECALAWRIRLKLVEFCMDWLRGDWTPHKPPYRSFEKAVFDAYGLIYPSMPELQTIAEKFVFDEGRLAGRRLPEGRMFTFFAPIGFWRLFDAYLTQPVPDEWLRQLEKKRAHAEKKLKLVLHRRVRAEIRPPRWKQRIELYVFYGAWMDFSDIAAGVEIIEQAVKISA